MENEKKNPWNIQDNPVEHAVWEFHNRPEDTPYYHAMYETAITQLSKRQVLEFITSLYRDGALGHVTRK